MRRDSFVPELAAAGGLAVFPPALIHAVGSQTVYLSSGFHFWAVGAPRSWPPSRASR